MYECEGLQGQFIMKNNINLQEVIYQMYLYIILNHHKFYLQTLSTQYTTITHQIYSSFFNLIFFQFKHIFISSQHQYYKFTYYQFKHKNIYLSYSYLIITNIIPFYIFPLFLYIISILNTSMKPKQIIPQKFYSIEIPQTTNTYTDKDSIIYALGIGFSQDPMKTQDYKYTSQFDQNFRTFPTYYACLSFTDAYTPLAKSPYFPEFNPMMILHAQERIEVYKPLCPNVNYIHNAKYIDVADKGKIALLTWQVQTKTKNEKGQLQLVGKCQSSLAIKGLGGFGYKGKGVAIKIPEKPTRKPDLIIQETSFPGQAFIYRLSGDPNPLHINPDMSAMQNFPRPIIHGLASYGIVARGIVEKVFGGNSNILKVYHTRFLGHVFPGQGYIINIWKQGSYIWFNVTVKQRGTICLIGYLETHGTAKL